MHSNDGRQACGRITKKVNPFMIVEIGQVPERRHDDNPPHQKLRGVAMVPIVNGYAGSIIWENGRPRGFEPPTSGTTNQRSNQLSYDRHNALVDRKSTRLNSSH